MPAQAAVSIYWHAPQRLESGRNGGLSDVACASVKLCVAVDTTGYAIASTNPGAAKKPWGGPFKIDSVTGGSLTSVSCPSVKLCVAVDAAGDVLSSTNPAGRSKAWTKPVRIDATTSGGSLVGIAALSCPTTTLCVAVDSASPANILASTNPTGGASAWKIVKKLGGPASSISCVATTSTLCVATGASAYVSTNPASTSGTWRATGVQTGGGTFSGIACPSLTLCVAVGFGNTSTGLATATTTPRGAAASWTTTTVQLNPPNAGAGLFDGVGCFSNSYCVAVDSADNAFGSSNAAGGVWGAQTDIEPISTSPTTNSAIGCATTVCVVVDNNGYAITGAKRGS